MPCDVHLPTQRCHAYSSRNEIRSGGDIVDSSGQKPAPSAASGKHAALLSKDRPGTAVFASLRAVMTKADIRVEGPTATRGLALSRPAHLAVDEQLLERALIAVGLNDAVRKAVLADHTRLFREPDVAGRGRADFWALDLCVAVLNARVRGNAAVEATSVAQTAPVGSPPAALTL